MDNHTHTHTELPPPLEHITTNIVPLSDILRKFADFSYAELSHVLQMEPNDLVKQRKLMDLCVYIRMEFARLYVLTKWSRASAHDFTTFVDLLAFLREQTSHFTNLVWATKSLNQSLLSAKLPNPDLITALEVFTNGRPTLPSHNFIESKISPKKVLETLQDLNIVISMKYALVDDLPTEFSNYEIKDGRIYIYTDDYHLQITAASEDSPFYMIDFKLTFGEFEKGRNLTKICNDALRKSAFQDLKRILTNYTNTMKLYLIHQKLNQLKNVKHSYHPEKFQITVHYWINSFVFKYSHVEIGINKQDKIVFKWVRQGEFVEIFEEADDIDMFLRDIYHRHSMLILSQIDDLTVNKSLLQLNELTGIFYFKNSTPTLNLALKKLNVDDFKNINTNLKAIRADLKFSEIATILSVTGWVQNDLIKLQSNELTKLPNHFFRQDQSISSTKSNVKFYSRKEWASNWFLILTIDTTIKTYIGNVRSVLGHWTLSNTAELFIESIDYKSSKQTVEYVSKKIMTHLITQELSGVNYKIRSDDCVILETDSFVKIPNASKLLMLEFKVESKNSLMVKLKGKLETSVQLDDFIIDPNGVFEIFESVNFKRSNILTNIIIKLQKLAKMIELGLQLKSVNLVSVKLDQIVFRYASDQLCTLKVDTFEVELPKTNPHNMCLPSIRQALVSFGLKDVLYYLQNSFGLISKLDELSHRAHEENFKDSEMGNVRFEVIPKTATAFTVLYYKSTSKLRKCGEMNIKLRNYDDRFMYLVQLVPAETRLAKELMFNESSFGVDKPRFLILMGDGVVCDDDGLELVIDHMHKRSMAVYR